MTPELPVFTVEQVAQQLKSGFFSPVENSWNISPGDTIDVDVSRLTPAGQYLALTALEAWTMVSGINFNPTSLEVVAFGYAETGIVFDDSELGAFSNFLTEGENEIYAAKVNISPFWILTNGTGLDTYSFQTFIHEIGHALGLEHAGDYNGDARYPQDALYANDSWQMSLMSYFSQDDNTTIDASFAYTVTPMIADILAIQQLYGVDGTLRDGDTVYLEGSNAGGYYGELAGFSEPTTFTLIDDGGFDVIDTSSATNRQIVDLQDGAISDIYGLRGNMIINTGTIIESFVSGSGNDQITGNAAGNILSGGDGNDVLFGEAGRDLLFGGAGRDYLIGGEEQDALVAGAGFDILIGGGASDTFVFQGSDGLCVVTDFELGIDALAFSGDLSAGDLFVQNSGDDTRVWLEGSLVILTGVDSTLVSIDDFLFV